MDETANEKGYGNNVNITGKEEWGGGPNVKSGLRISSGSRRAEEYVSKDPTQKDKLRNHRFHGLKGIGENWGVQDRAISGVEGGKKTRRRGI